jgi:hypothetical protein
MSQRWRLLGALALAAPVAILSLSGCMPSGPNPQVLADDQKACQEQFPKMGEARAKCLNAVVNKDIRPSYPYPDLLDVMNARRMDIELEVADGRMTEARGRAEIAKTESEITSEALRRSNQAAQTGAAWAAATPTPPPAVPTYASPSPELFQPLPGPAPIQSQPVQLLTPAPAPAQTLPLGNRELIYNPQGGVTISPMPSGCCGQP